MTSEQIGLWVQRAVAFALAVGFFVGLVILLWHPLHTMTIFASIYLAIIWVLEGLAIRMVAHMMAATQTVQVSATVGSNTGVTTAEVGDVMDNNWQLLFHSVLWPIWLWSFIK